jgi:hypothetical protein
MNCPTCRQRITVPVPHVLEPAAPEDSFNELEVAGEERFDDLEVVADHRVQNFLPPGDVYRGIRLLRPCRYAIKAQSGFFDPRLAYDIFDADSNNWLGQVNEDGAPALQWLFPRRWFSTRVDVREGHERSLVFSVQRPGYLFSTRVQIVDGNGRLVGSFQSRAFALFYRGFPLCDQNERPIANAILQRNPSRLVFLSSNGRQWGQVINDNWGKLDFMGAFRRGGNYHVDVEPELADQPLAKLLLLATAFAIDLLWQDAMRDSMRARPSM